MTSVAAGDSRTDHDLVRAAVCGNQTALATIYDRYADRLYDYCAGLVGERDAADCVQEAFCVAAADLPALRDPTKVAPWLYAIARHQAFRTLRARRRELVSDTLPERACERAGPDVQVLRDELGALIAAAEQGLSERDRRVLNLVYRHELRVPELSRVLGVSASAAKKIVQRMRVGVERSLGALLVARRVASGHHGCQELSMIVGGWDGEFTILLRKRISRHIECCLVCEEERARMVDPTLLLSGTGARSHPGVAS
jgi:RNA polymerase sigma factor (sigma-70 family)